MKKLEEVFKKSGIPTVTFVRPNEYERVAVGLRVPGRGVIIEGPSGIGKTSCVRRAIENQGMEASCIFLSARKKQDVQFIQELPEMNGVGLVVIDDFHKLPDGVQKVLTDFLKVLADEEDGRSKLILIGINRAGQSLVNLAPDLLHRIDMVRFGPTTEEKLDELISSGEKALNCCITIKAEIVKEAEGSFAMAQVLCFEACLQSHFTEESAIRAEIGTSLPATREAVLRDLSTRLFSRGTRFRDGK
jgi:Cdc6-like AAA superfamily ATPase